jgi:hypothetical protein
VTALLQQTNPVKAVPLNVSHDPLLSEFPKKKVGPSIFRKSIPVAARSKAWICGRSLVGIVGSSPSGVWMFFSWGVVCCQIDVSASGWSLVQGSPNWCGVSVIVKPQNWGGPGPLGLSKHIKGKYIPHKTALKLKNCKIVSTFRHVRVKHVSFLANRKNIRNYSLL